jgi:choline kinase
MSAPTLRVLDALTTGGQDDMKMTVSAEATDIETERGTVIEIGKGMTETETELEIGTEIEIGIGIDEMTGNVLVSENENGNVDVHLRQIIVGQHRLSRAQGTGHLVLHLKHHLYP